MDTRVGAPTSEPGSGSTDAGVSEWLLPSFPELVLALPVRAARALTALLRPYSTRPGRDGIEVPAMSREWLQQHAADAEKHDLP